MENKTYSIISKKDGVIEKYEKTFVRRYLLDLHNRNVIISLKILNIYLSKQKGVVVMLENMKKVTNQ